PPLGEADAELGLLAAERAALAALDAAPDAGVEAADLHDEVPPEGRVPAHDVADARPGGGHAAVAAAHRPVELLRKPAGAPPGRPQRIGPPADPDHRATGGGVVHRVLEGLEPAGVGDRVVVQVGDDVAGGDLGPGVLATGQAALVAVLHHERVRILPLEPQVEIRVVIHHEDQLVRPAPLVTHGVDGRPDVLPSLLGVDADDDRNAHAAPWSAVGVAVAGFGRGVGTGRRYSRRMVLSTRQPSRIARRLLSPWIRDRSRLGTSCTLSPAFAARMVSTVSRSNPAQPMLSPSRRRAPEA